LPLSSTSIGKIEELLIKPTDIAARIATRKKAKAAISGKSYKPTNISPRVRQCLDSGGTFVAMLFGNDSIDTEEDATEKAIQAFLTASALSLRKLADQKSGWVSAPKPRSMG
jgi:hypothetical protein